MSNHFYKSSNCCCLSNNRAFACFGVFICISFDGKVETFVERAYLQQLTNQPNLLTLLIVLYWEKPHSVVGEGQGLVVMMVVVGEFQDKKVRIKKNSEETHFLGPTVILLQIIVT